MHKVPFTGRRHAGRELARLLSAYSADTDAIVLALPRGGVPVAYEVSKTLGLPLDVFVVRKLGFPEQEELAMGAIASGGVTVTSTHLSPIQRRSFEDVKKKELIELQRREELYRGLRPFPKLKGKKVLLIDDGIATGASMQVAVHSLRLLKPERIVVAVPVAAADSLLRMQALADEVEVAFAPEQLEGVGEWYEDFSETSDSEVLDLLADSDCWTEFGTLTTRHP